MYVNYNNLSSLFAILLMPVGAALEKTTPSDKHVCEGLSIISTRCGSTVQNVERNSNTYHPSLLNYT